MPKPKGRHPDKALTALKVRQVSKPGRYADGNGLYLTVDPSGAKRWLLRIVVQGRRRDIGLGGLSIISLAEARETAREYRRIARDGGDPIAQLRKAPESAPTFSEASERVFQDHKASWDNAKHQQQWINTLRTYAYPVLGEMRVDQIQTPDVLRVLFPIWLTKAETARRVKQRIGTVLDWAGSAGYRSGENPTAGVTKGLPKQPKTKRHHAALPYTEVPAFVAQLRSSTNDGQMARLAFEFLISTASRTSEVLKARWNEVDLEKALWTVPADRMKAKHAHRVPLCDRCVVILELARQLDIASHYLFPGIASDRPFSNAVFLSMLKRMEVACTAHGFRSSFRDWAAETTAYPRDVAEMALAHTIRDKTEAAYRRGDMLERRREMMQDWAEFIEQSE
jgi:integrase